MKHIFILLFILPALLPAQVENSRGKTPYHFQPDFYIDLAVYKSDDSSKSRVEAFIQTPYSNLQFVKTGNIYEANYLITLLFRDEENDDVIFEKVWKEKITNDRFESTISPRNSNISHKTIELVPGNYRIECFLEDIESRKTAEYTREIIIRSFDKPVGVSDPLLIENVIESDQGRQIIPNISKILTTSLKKLEFIYEIYSDETREVNVFYQLNDKSRDEVKTQFFHKTLPAGKSRFTEILQNTDLDLGEYEFGIIIKDLEDNVLAKSGKRFRSIIFGFPITITDLDLAVEQMKYIASDEEIDFIEDAEDYDTKMKRFIAYWTKKDPSPGTDENEILFEYYRRVEYANEHFNSYYDGWRTDMGMIYIVLGPPNQVDRHPFDEGSKPYEVWSYFDFNRQFVFIDYTGFGDYRLYQPVYGDWYRYRQ